MKIQAIKLDEPFGLYTLAMAKSDSDAALKYHREYRKRIEMWSEFGMTIVTIGFCFLGLAAFVLQGITS